jgi:hypothetical protein
MLRRRRGDGMIHRTAKRVFQMVMMAAAKQIDLKSAATRVMSTAYGEFD